MTRINKGEQKSKGIMVVIMVEAMKEIEGKHNITKMIKNTPRKEEELGL